MAYNMPARTAEFATIASALACPVEPGATELDRAHSAVYRVAELLGSVGIPASLAELGLERDRLDWVAEQGMAAARLVDNNPQPLDSHELRLIVGAAFEGDLAGLLDATWRVEMQTTSG